MSNYSVRDRIEEAMTLVHSAVHVGHITLSTNKRFRDFLDNIHAQVEKGKKLSGGQTKYLTDIENHCSAKNVSEAVDWVNNYDDDLRQVAVTCAQYYDQQGTESSYFRRIRRKVLDNPEGHILSKVEFSKMCMNKYAVKMLNEMKTPWKFTEGQLVVIRKTNRLDMAPYKDRNITRSAYHVHRKAARNELLAMVVCKNPRPMYRSTAGGKVYSIMPVGSMDCYYACEKDLKAKR